MTDVEIRTFPLAFSEILNSYTLLRRVQKEHISIIAFYLNHTNSKYEVLLGLVTKNVMKIFAYEPPQRHPQ